MKFCFCIRTFNLSKYFSFDVSNGCSSSADNVKFCDKQNFLNIIKLHTKNNLQSHRYSLNIPYIFFSDQFPEVGLQEHVRNDCADYASTVDRQTPVKYNMLTQYLKIPQIKLYQIRFYALTIFNYATTKVLLTLCFSSAKLQGHSLTLNRLQNTFMTLAFLGKRV